MRRWSSSRRGVGLALLVVNMVCPGEVCARLSEAENEKLSAECLSLKARLKKKSGWQLRCAILKAERDL